MEALEKKHFRILGLTVAMGSFLLLLVGVGLVLENELSIRNIAAFLGFSFLAGLIAVMLGYLRLKMSLIFFMTGLGIGFWEMYRSFFNDLSGWGDLIGIMSLFMWSLIGLGIGLMIQFSLYLYQKFKSK